MYIFTKQLFIILKPALISQVVFHTLCKFMYTSLSHIRIDSTTEPNRSTLTNIHQRHNKCNQDCLKTKFREGTSRHIDTSLRSQQNKRTTLFCRPFPVIRVIHAHFIREYISRRFSREKPYPVALYCRAEIGPGSSAKTGQLLELFAV